jgi:FlgD Ig-like domain
MKRNAPTILALLLLVGTATAFAVTQRLKLEPSPISQTRVDETFSPVCRCASKVARIDFSLRRADQLRIAIRTPSGEVTIADGSFPRGDVHVSWNGRDGSGEPLPDGVYFPLVHLRKAGRTIDLPNPIRIDTMPPRIKLHGVQRTRTRTLFIYRISEPAHALLFINGRRKVRTYSTRRHGRLPWYGDPSKARRVVLEAVDLAGNGSKPLPIHGLRR